jgi:molybdopterin/thiamine biosynthesis adenylyltransferase
MPEQDYYADAFSRNIGLLTTEEQDILKRSTIAIAGLGGVGGIHALSFARLGIGGFHIADPDTFEAANINRQAGAFSSTMGKNKAETMASMVKDINPSAQVKVFEGKIDETNVESFLEGVSIFVDGIDFFSTRYRRIVFGAARARGIPAVTAGPVGFGSAVYVFDPQGMSFDEYFDLHDGMSDEDMTIHFGIGITPALLQRSYFHPGAVGFKAKKAPSLVTGTLLAANLVTCEVVKLLIGRGKVRYVPKSSHFDPFVGKYRHVNLPGGNRNPLQRLKKWYFKRTLNI